MADGDGVITGPNGEIYTAEDLEEVGRRFMRAFLHNGVLGHPVPEDDAERIRQNLARGA